MVMAVQSKKYKVDKYVVETVDSTGFKGANGKDYAMDKNKTKAVDERNADTRCKYEKNYEPLAFLEPCEGKCPIMLCARDVGDNKCQLFDRTYVCNGECLNTYSPCNGTCRPETPVLCGEYCLSKSDAKGFYSCGADCNALSTPCHHKCHERLPKKCGPNCLAENETCELKTPECEGDLVPCGEMCIGKDDWRWDCDGECLKLNEPCNGKCHETQPKKCGEQCVKDDNSHQEYKGHCFKSHVYCGGKCAKHLPHKCKGSCEGARGDVLSKAETCDFPPKKVKYNTCVDMCVDEDTYKKEYKDCDGECILAWKPCKGKCGKKSKPCWGECVDARNKCPK